jgi:hypothetical protein
VLNYEHYGEMCCLNIKYEERGRIDGNIRHRKVLISLTVKKNKRKRD